MTPYYRDDGIASDDHRRCVMTGDGTSHRDMLLLATLDLAVPLAMAEPELQDWPTPELRQALREQSAAADEMLYGGRRCASAFTALARALALLALHHENGVTFAGRHWCRGGCSRCIDAATREKAAS